MASNYMKNRLKEMYAEAKERIYKEKRIIELIEARLAEMEREEANGK